MTGCRRRALEPRSGEESAGPRRTLRKKALAMDMASFMYVTVRYDVKARTPMRIEPAVVAEGGVFVCVGAGEATVGATGERKAGSAGPLRTGDKPALAKGARHCEGAG